MAHNLWLAPRCPTDSVLLSKLQVWQNPFWPSLSRQSFDPLKFRGALPLNCYQIWAKIFSIFKRLKLDENRLLKNHCSHESWAMIFAGKEDNSLDASLLVWSSKFENFQTWQWCRTQIGNSTIIVNSNSLNSHMPSIPVGAKRFVQRRGRHCPSVRIKTSTSDEIANY